MGGIEITVEHGDWDCAERFRDAGLHLEVKREPGACGPCRRNDDVTNVPCWECVGNIRRIDPDDPKGNLCRCTVVWIDDSRR
jgi:hypothetical protein